MHSCRWIHGQLERIFTRIVLSLYQMVMYLPFSWCVLTSPHLPHLSSSCRSLCKALIHFRSLTVMCLKLKHFCIYSLLLRATYVATGTGSHIQICRYCHICKLQMYLLPWCCINAVMCSIKMYCSRYMGTSVVIMSR